jgi:hypothetical protein
MGFLFFLPVSARAEELSMKAEIGFDGTYLLDYWTTVKVAVENSGSDLEGSLEVIVPGENNQSVVYAVPVSLPNTSSKEYTIYTKIQGLNRSLVIQLMDKKGKTIKKIKAENLNPISRDKYFLGLVTDDEPSLGYWKERTDSNQVFSNYQPISLNAENFPNRREILDNFSVLLFNNIDTSSFRPEQMDALNDWVADGGILIVGTGANGRRTLSGLSSSIVPVMPGEVSALSTTTVMEEISGKPILGPVPLNVMDLKTDEGTAIASQDAVELVWLHRKGSGVIYTAAFDIGTEPILSWAGNKMFWEKLLSGNLTDQSVQMLRNPYSRLQDRGGMEDVLGYIEAMELPSIAVILALFLLYLAMAGPINYIILKKFDKREWSWLTIPALSVIFAVAIYGLGYSAKGGEVIMNTISVVDMDSNSEGADLTNYVGIFMPKRGDYRIGVDRDALLSLNQRNTSYPVRSGNETTGVSDTRIVQGIPSGIEFNNVNIWTMKTFSMDTQRGNYGSIEANLYYELGKIKGTVENNTPYPLEDFVIYVSDSYTKAGNIAAGEKKNVELTLPVQTQSYYYKNYYTMLDNLYPYTSGSPSGTSQNRENMARRRLLESLIMNTDVPAAQPARPVTLPANQETQPFMAVDYFTFFEGDFGADILVNGKQPDKSVGQGIIMGSMPYTIEKDGFISIPPGFFFGRLEEDLSSRIESGKEMIFISNVQDYAVFSVDLSEFKDLRDLRAQIGVSYFSGQGVFQVLDLEEQGYVEIGSNTLEIDESNISRYMDENGLIYLKVQPRMDQLEMSLPSVTLEGRAE